MKGNPLSIAIKTHFWDLIGPFCILLTLSLQIVKPGIESLWLPYIGFCGVILCWKWQIKGLLISLGLLCAALIGNYQMLVPWTLGAGLTLALGFVITALSADLAGNNIQISVEPDRSQDVLINNLQNELQNLQEQSKSAIDQLQSQLEDLKQNKIKLESALAQANAELQKANVKLTASSKEQQKLNAQLSSSDVEKQSIKNQLATFITEKQHFKLQLAAGSTEQQTLKSQLAAAATEQQNLKSELASALAEKQNLTSQILELQASQQKVTPSENYLDEFKRYENLYNQLRKQFEEKSNLLDATRREQFLTQELFEQYKRQHNETELYHRSKHEKEMENYILELECRYREQCEGLQQEIQDLQDIITTLTHPQCEPVSS